MHPCSPRCAALQPHPRHGACAWCLCLWCCPCVQRGEQAGAAGGAAAAAAFKPPAAKRRTQRTPRGMAGTCGHRGCTAACVGDACMHDCDRARMRACVHACMPARGASGSCLEAASSRVLAGMQEHALRLPAQPSSPEASGGRPPHTQRR